MVDETYIIVPVMLLGIGIYMLVIDLNIVLVQQNWLSMGMSFRLEIDFESGDTGTCHFTVFKL